MFQAVLVGDENLTGFATFKRTHDSGGFQLVDDSSGTVIADRETSLDGGGGALLGVNHQPGGFLEQRVFHSEVHISTNPVFRVGNVFG